MSELKNEQFETKEDVVVEEVSDQPVQDIEEVEEASVIVDFEQKLKEAEDKHLRL